MTTTETHPQTNHGRMVKRGDTFDIEDSRTSYRLRQAQGILRGMGVEPTYPDHAETCILNPKNKGNRCYGVSYRCECGIGVDPPATWPEWVTGRTFDLAYELASEIQTARGDYNRSH